MPIFSGVVTLWMVKQELGLFTDIDHVCGGGEGLGQVEQGLQSMGVGREQGDVICDTDGTHTDTSHVEAQGSIVGHIQLLVVDQLEVVPRVDPSSRYYSLFDLLQLLFAELNLSIHQLAEFDSESYYFWF